MHVSYILHHHYIHVRIVHLEVAKGTFAMNYFGCKHTKNRSATAAIISLEITVKLFCLNQYSTWIRSQYHADVSLEVSSKVDF